MNEEKAAQPHKMGSIKRGWIITKSAWEIMKLDKEIVLVPLIFGVIGLVVGIVGFGGGFLLSNNFSDYYHSTVNSVEKPNSQSVSPQFGHTTEAVWVITALALAIISTFTLAAMVAMALKRMRGGDPVLSDGLAAVRKNFGSLTLFAIFSFGIIQLLQYLQSRLPFLGKILAFLGRIAWSVAAFFAVPIIVDSPESLGPIKATRESITLIKKTWRESGTNRFVVGSLFFLVILFELLVGIGATALAAHAVNEALAAVSAILMLIVVLLTILVSSAIEGIAKAVLYYYAVTGEAPAEFDKRLLQEAFTAKKARKIFA